MNIRRLDFLQTIERIRKHLNAVADKLERAVALIFSVKETAENCEHGYGVLWQRLDRLSARLEKLEEEVKKPPPKD